MRLLDRIGVSILGIVSVLLLVEMSIAQDPANQNQPSQKIADDPQQTKFHLEAAGRQVLAEAILNGTIPIDQNR